MAKIRVARDRPFRLSPGARQLLQCLLEYGSLDQIRLYRLSVTPHQLISSPAAAQDGPHGMVKVILQVKGTTHYDQMGRQVLLEPGSWMIRDLDLPYMVNILEPCELIVAMLPRSSISTAGFALRDLCLRRFSGTTGLGNVVHNVIQTTYQEFVQSEEAAAPDLASAMTQLVRLQLLQVCKELNQDSLREVLQARVKRYVAFPPARSRSLPRSDRPLHALHQTQSP